MPIYRPSELLPFLKEHALKIKKSLSQNFLIDGNIIQKILQLAAVSADDFIIEIGPGPGALTQALLNTGAQVLALEIDSTFAHALKRLDTPDHRLHILSTDALEFPWEKTLKEYLKPGQKAKIISNLPYHITSPLLGKILPLFEDVSQVTIMVQKEVALRMLAKPGSKEISSLSLFVQYYSNASYGFTVKPQCFLPAPKVHSAVVQLSLKPSSQTESEPLFDFIHTAFQKRRKTLRSSLKSLYPSDVIVSALQTLSLKEDTRPELLDLNLWMRLFQLLQRN